MNNFVPYSRRQPQKPVEPRTVLAHLYIELGPRHEFRIQVLQNLESVIGVRRPVKWTRTNNCGQVVTPSTIWKAILAAVEHEYGFSLSGDRDDTARNAFADWFLREDQPNTYILSAMEFAFRIASQAAPAIASYQDEYHSRMTVEQAVADVNERFK
jgi:hypothetical protein